MADTRKLFRLEVVTERSADAFSFPYDTEREANLAAEQILKQGYVIHDFSADETTPYRRCYIPLSYIVGLDVVVKEG